MDAPALGALNARQIGGVVHLAGLGLKTICAQLAN